MLINWPCHCWVRIQHSVVLTFDSIDFNESLWVLVDINYVNSQLETVLCYGAYAVNEDIGRPHEVICHCCGNLSKKLPFI